MKFLSANRTATFFSAIFYTASAPPGHLFVSPYNTSFLLCGANVVHPCGKKNQGNCSRGMKVLPCINYLGLFTAPIHQQARKKGMKK